MKLIKKATVFLFLILNFFLLSKTAFSNLKINEIYPAPSSGEEWVELYNNSNQLIDLSNYSLFDAKNKEIIISTNSALPYDFVLATSSGVLNNQGPETVYLKDNSDNILDTASYSATFDENKSFIRCPDGIGEWFMTNIITKGRSNSSVCLTPTLTLILTPTITQVVSSTPTPTPVSVSYEKIYLSEAMINPLNGEKEWVEIYNDNDFLVKLDNWFIDDLENAGSTPKSFNITIDKKSYRVIELSGAIFNNDGDQVRLLDFNKLEKDSFEYSSSETGKSYGRISFDIDEWCQQEPSKGQKNNSCLVNQKEANSFSTVSFVSQTIDPSSTLLIKNTNNFSFDQSINKDKTKKIYKSFQPKLQNFISEKNLSTGEVLGEETDRNNKKGDILFLPVFQSLLSNFLFFKKILKKIPID